MSTPSISPVLDGEAARSWPLSRSEPALEGNGVGRSTSAARVSIEADIGRLVPRANGARTERRVRRRKKPGTARYGELGRGSPTQRMAAVKDLLDPSAGNWDNTHTIHSFGNEILHKTARMYFKNEGVTSRVHKVTQQFKGPKASTSLHIACRSFNAAPTYSPRASSMETVPQTTHGEKKNGR